jgi:hypothetical protein
VTVNQQKARSFRLILKSLLRKSELSVQARFLWALIDSYADHNGDNCFPSIPLLAKAAGHPERWVKRYLKELKEGGFVEIRKRKTNSGWSNLYVLKVSGG